MANEAARPRKAAAAAGSRDGLPVQRIRPAYQQVAEQLRELVVSGAVGPGDRLPVEGVLSAGVRRQPQHHPRGHPLVELAVTVHTVPGPTGGTFVSQSDPESLRELLATSIGLLSGNQGITAGELLEVREALEVPAARLAAQRRTDAHLAAMRASVERELDQTGRTERFVQNQEFHAQVLEAAGNRLLSVVTGPVYQVIQARFLKEEDRPFFLQVHDEHTEILGFIERGDSEGAGLAMYDHLIRLRGVYGHIDSLEPAAAPPESSSTPAVTPVVTPVATRRVTAPRSGPRAAAAARTAKQRSKD